uniref:Secreted protein n=1 Tax=Rhizophora mucronata TaxID=61149 RepID=A0A2P2QRM0_RHIMU
MLSPTLATCLIILLLPPSVQLTSYSLSLVWSLAGNHGYVDNPSICILAWSLSGTRLHNFVA